MHRTSHMYLPCSHCITSQVWWQWHAESPAAFSNNFDLHPHFFFHTLNWFASFYICCCLSWHCKKKSLKCTEGWLSFPSLPSKRFSFFSRDKKRLANTQRNVHIQESFGQWANSHRDDSYTEQGQEALQHLWPQPASTLGPELSTASACSGTWQLQVLLPCTPLGSDAPLELIPQTNCFEEAHWKTDAKL